MDKKLQIFISSTYIDLREERQKVVQAILDAGHIPAGMELFSAGDESQMNTIKQWIDDSDIYLLLLGKRYGSIDPISGKSYTQLEYEYAVEKKKPLFSLVINNPTGMGDETNLDLYKEFKESVLKKVVKFCDDTKDVKYNTVLSINELYRKYNDKLLGWSKGNSSEELNRLLRENISLNDKVTKLEKKIQKINKGKTDLYGTLTFSEVMDVLNKEIEFPETLTSSNKSFKASINKFLIEMAPYLATGVTNSNRANDDEIFIFQKVAQELLAIGLAEIVKAPGSATWQRIRLNKDGQRFIQQLNKHNLSKKD
jgi:hypothetical protein